MKKAAKDTQGDEAMRKARKRLVHEKKPQISRGIVERIEKDLTSGPAGFYRRVSRLKRERPDLFAQVVAKKL